MVSVGPDVFSAESVDRVTNALGHRRGTAPLVRLQMSPPAAGANAELHGAMHTPMPNSRPNQLRRCHCGVRYHARGSFSHAERMTPAVRT